MTKILTSNSLEQWRQAFNDLESDYSSTISGITSNDSDIASLVDADLGHDSDIASLVAADLGHDSDISILQTTTANTTDAFTKTSGNITLQDNVKLILGSGGDLEIYHDGVNNIITGSALNLDTAEVRLTSGTTDWKLIISNEKLVFKYGSTNVMQIDSAGNMTILGDIDVSGTVSG